jgi:dTDP-4-dehydrorhamnose reductase
MVLVVGCFGQLGSATVNHLLSTAHQVVSCGRVRSSARQQISGSELRKIESLEKMTIRDWSRILEGVSRVVYCSSVTPALANNLFFRSRYERVNVTALETFLKAADLMRIKHVVYISSGYLSLARLVPCSPYLDSKRKAEIALRNCSVPVTILRPFPILGKKRTLLQNLCFYLGFFGFERSLLGLGEEMRYTSLCGLVNVISDLISKNYIRGCPVIYPIDQGGVSLYEVAVITRQVNCRSVQRGLAVSFLNFILLIVFSIIRSRNVSHNDLIAEGQIVYTGHILPSLRRWAKANF